MLVSHIDIPATYLFLHWIQGSGKFTDQGIPPGFGRKIHNDRIIFLTVWRDFDLQHFAQRHIGHFFQRRKAFLHQYGGDIFIHGGPRPGIDRTGPDWTWGCIAVTGDEMEDIYAMVRDGTPITIHP